MLFTLSSHCDLVWIFSTDLSFSSLILYSFVPSFLLNQSIKFLNSDTIFSILQFPFNYFLNSFQFYGQISCLVIYFLAHINHSYLNIYFWTSFGSVTIACFFLLLLVLSPDMPGKFHWIPATVCEKILELTWDSGRKLSSSGRNLGIRRIISQSGIELSWSCVFSLCGSWQISSMPLFLGCRTSVVPTESPWYLPCPLLRDLFWIAMFSP